MKLSIEIEAKNQAQKAFKELDKNLKSVAGSLKLIKATASPTTGELKKLQAAFIVLTSAMKKQAISSKTLKQYLKEVGPAYQKLNFEQKFLYQSLKKFGLLVTNTVGRLSIFRTAVIKAGAAMGAWWKGGLGSLPSVFRNFGRQIFYVGVQIGTLIMIMKNLMQPIVEFQSKMANVSTMIIKDVGRWTKIYSSAVMQMAMDTGLAMNDLADSLYNILSGGQAVEKAAEIMKVAGVIAVAGVSDVASSAKLLVNILNTYGRAAGGIVTISNKLFGALYKGQYTFKQLAANLGKILTTGALSGIPFEQMLAWVATITQSGVDVEESMTGVRNVIKSVRVPTDKATKALGLLNLKMNESQFANEGILGILKALEGASTQRVAQIFRESRALEKGLLPVLNNLEYFYGAYENIAVTSLEGQGAAIVALLKQIGKLELLIARLSETWKALRIQLFTGLIPVFEIFLKSIMVLMQRINKLSEAEKKSIGKKVLLTTLIIGLAPPISILVGAFASLTVSLVIAVFSGFVPLIKYLLLTILNIGKLGVALKFLILPLGAIAATQAGIGIIIASLLSLVGILIVSVNRAQDLADAWKVVFMEMNIALLEFFDNVHYYFGTFGDIVTSVIPAFALLKLALKDTVPDRKGVEDYIAEIAKLKGLRPPGIEGPLLESGAFDLKETKGVFKIYKEEIAKMFGAIVDYAASAASGTAKVFAKSLPGAKWLMENLSSGDMRKYIDGVIAEAEKAAPNLANMLKNIFGEKKGKGSALGDEVQRLNNAFKELGVVAPEVINKYLFDITESIPVIREFGAMNIGVYDGIIKKLNEVRTYYGSLSKELQEFYNTVVNDVGYIKKNIADSLLGQISDWENWGEQIEKAILDVVDTFQTSLSDELFAGLSGKVTDFGNIWDAVLNDVRRSLANIQSKQITNFILKITGIKGLLEKWGKELGGPTQTALERNAGAVKDIRTAMTDIVQLSKDWGNNMSDAASRMSMGGGGATPAFDSFGLTSSGMTLDYIKQYPQISKEVPKKISSGEITLGDLWGKVKGLFGGGEQDGVAGLNKAADQASIALTGKAGGTKKGFAGALKGVTGLLGQYGGVIGGMAGGGGIGGIGVGSVVGAASSLIGGKGGGKGGKGGGNWADTISPYLGVLGMAIGAIFGDDGPHVNKERARQARRENQEVLQEYVGMGGYLPTGADPESAKSIFPWGASKKDLEKLGNALQDIVKGLGDTLTKSLERGLNAVSMSVGYEQFKESFAKGITDVLVKTLAEGLAGTTFVQELLSPILDIIPYLSQMIGKGFAILPDLFADLMFRVLITLAPLWEVVVQAFYNGFIVPAGILLKAMWDYIVEPAIAAMSAVFKYIAEQIALLPYIVQMALSPLVAILTGVFLGVFYKIFIGLAAFAVNALEPVFNLMWKMVMELRVALNAFSQEVKDMIRDGFNVMEAETQKQFNFMKKFYKSMTSVIAKALKAGFESGTKEAGWEIFQREMREGLYEAIVDGIISAAAAFGIFMQLIGPYLHEISKLILQAFLGNWDPDAWSRLMMSIAGGAVDALKGMKPWFDGLWDGMKKLFDMLMHGELPEDFYVHVDSEEPDMSWWDQMVLGIQTFLAPLTELLDIIIDKLKEAWEKLIEFKDEFPEIWDTIMLGLWAWFFAVNPLLGLILGAVALFDWIKNFDWSTLKNIVNNLLDFGWGIFKGLVDGLLNFTWSKLSDLLDWLLNWEWPGLTWLLNWLLNWQWPVLSGLLQWLQDITGLPWTWLENLINGLKNHEWPILSGIINGLKNWDWPLLSGLVKWLKKLLGIPDDLEPPPIDPTPPSPSPLPFLPTHRPTGFLFGGMVPREGIYRLHAKEEIRSPYTNGPYSTQQREPSIFNITINATISETQDIQVLANDLGYLVEKRLER